MIYLPTSPNSTHRPTHNEIHRPNTIMNPTTPNPIRSKTSYSIPSTSLTLELTLGLDLPLPIASIRSCLTGALALARTHSPQALTPATKVSFQQPQSENNADALFEIVGDPVFGTNELTWGDVVEVLKGLEQWIEEREERGEGSSVFWFRILEEGEVGKGQIGDGYLTKKQP